MFQTIDAQWSVPIAIALASLSFPTEAQVPPVSRLNVRNRIAFHPARTVIMSWTAAAEIRLRPIDLTMGKIAIASASLRPMRSVTAK